MTGRLRRRLVTSVLVAALGTACGGGGTNKDVHPRATDPRRVVEARSGSTIPAPAPPTARPRVRAFDGVAPPAILDRGSDHVAIATSLLKYGRWLDWHHPDPALVTRAYLPGSGLAAAVAADVAKNRLARRHIIEVDDAPFEFTVGYERADLVSYDLVEHVARRDVIDDRGRVVQHKGPRTEHYLIVIMRWGPDSPWGLNVVERRGPRLELQL